MNVHEITHPQCDWPLELYPCFSEDRNAKRAAFNYYATGILVYLKTDPEPVVSAARIWGALEMLYLLGLADTVDQSRVTEIVNAMKEKK